MSTISVHRGTIGDLDALVPLFDAYRQFYAQPADPDGARAFLAERLAQGESVVLIAWDESGAPLGFTQLYPSFTSIAMKRIFILNDLYVLPQARGRGVGTALLDAATDHARSVGAVRLRLSTAIDNLTAQQLYAANGWVRDERFWSYDRALG